MIHSFNDFPPVRTVRLVLAVHWLQAGWRDFTQSGWVSLLHGIAMCAAGAIIAILAYDRFWLLAGALSGFMVVAPVLATGLYALSRAIERKEKANAALVLTTWLRWQNSHFNQWTPDYWCMFRFGLLLMLAASGWVITSAALISLLAPAPVHTPLDFLHFVVLAHDGWLFEIWVGVGGIMAAPVFASSVVAMPLLLDRKIKVLPAILCSWRVVLANPVVMAVWATIILLLTLLGMAFLLLGLVIVIPVLGHASWHAYRDLVDTNALEPREALSPADSRFRTL